MKIQPQIVFQMSVSLDRMEVKNFAELLPFFRDIKQRPEEAPFKALEKRE